MKTIKLPIFNCIIHVFFDEDVETAIKKIEKKIKCGVLNYENASGVQISNGGVHAIWVGADADVGTIAHECYHCLKRIMEDIDSQQEDEEVCAYLQGFLTEKVYGFWLKHLSKKSKKDVE